MVLLLACLCTFPAAAEDRVLDVEVNKGLMLKLPRAATSIVVADPATADVQVVSPKLAFIHGRRIGETSIYAVDSHDDTILSAVVHVTHDISGLERTIKRVAPDADVEFKTAGGGLVMNGYAGTVAEAENIRNVAQSFIGANDRMVNMITTGGSDQVMLKVKVVEMSRTDLKRFGINLQNVVNNGNFSLQLLQGADILFNTAEPGVFAYNTPGSVLRRSSANNSNLYLRYNDINGLLEALETQGLATVLAEPSLTTTSGKAASFLAGGQFPIPVVQPSGSGNTITIQYQPFGVGLNFSPVVMSHDRISLTVAPEVSTLDFNNPIQVSGVTYPIINTRRASAVVELGSGDSFMLAGLMRSETTNTVSKFPGLGDLPILGTLFRSTQFQNNQTELVILVTPYIVHPEAQHKLATPMDGYTPPNDVQRLVSGSLYQQQAMTEEEKQLPPSAPKLHGKGGFILE